MPRVLLRHSFASAATRSIQLPALRNSESSNCGRPVHRAATVVVGRVGNSLGVANYRRHLRVWGRVRATRIARARAWPGAGVLDPRCMS
jgi:hypothetical protein